ncbi:MAG: hypothetical protein K6G70_00730 [Bacteroidaceae bacterium]|nr:hypothetical protein [Bacteroidaceae bacterium]
MNKLHYIPLLLGLGLGAFVITSCVDNDYDIENIDKTIKVGSGEFKLPMSSTNKIKLNNLFSLAEDGAIIKKNEKYYVHTSGAADPQSIEVSSITFPAPNITGIKETNMVILNPKYSGNETTKSVPRDVAIGIIKDFTYPYSFGQDIYFSFNEQDADEPVTPEIIGFKDVGFDGQQIRFNVYLKNPDPDPLHQSIKQLYFDDFYIDLPFGLDITKASFKPGISADEFTVTPVVDDDNKRIRLTFFKALEEEETESAELAARRIFKVSGDYNIATIAISVEKIEVNDDSFFKFTPPANENAKGKIGLKKDVARIRGSISIKGSDISDEDIEKAFPTTEPIINVNDYSEIGARLFPSYLTFKGDGNFYNTVTEKDEISVASFSGQIRREIDVINDIELNNLPDFLKEDDVKLDLANPQLYLKLDCDIPTEIKLLDLKMEAKKQKGGVSETINIGTIDYTNEYYMDGGVQKKKPLMLQLAPDITKLDKPEDEGWATDNAIEMPIQIANLPDLLKEVPKAISIYRGDHKKLVVELPDCQNVAVGRTYTVKLDYMVNCPLEFGQEFKISYRGDETGLNLGGDFNELDVDGIGIEAKITSNIPLKVKLNITPIDKNGIALTGLRIDKYLNGVLQPGDLEIPAGTTANPSTAKIGFKIVSPGTGKISDALKDTSAQQLDGFKYSAVLEQGVSNEALSPDTYLQLEDMTITLLGGITYNDKDKK